ncbi:hypothetical protein WP5W18E02_09640 [Aeromonas caviae]|nr:hypothetical protein WP5W18E02_09640 [Aeromonas caviae]
MNLVFLIDLTEMGKHNSAISRICFCMNVMRSPHASDLNSFLNSGCHPTSKSIAIT